MRWIAVAVPVVVACIAALLLSQQKILWHVTEPGMSLAEVRAVLPDAEPPAQPRRLGNGLSLGLVAPNVSNLDRAFDAELYFDDDGLKQVLLLPTRLLAVPAAMREFDELRQAASRRYGRGACRDLDAIGRRCGRGSLESRPGDHHASRREARGLCGRHDDVRIG